MLSIPIKNKLSKLKLRKMEKVLPRQTLKCISYVHTKKAIIHSISNSKVKNWNLIVNNQPDLADAH